jgi:hypothetical protein
MFIDFDWMSACLI